MGQMKTNKINTTINVLSDGEVWVEGDCAYFKKVEMLEGSEAFDNFENDILPRENEDGITEYASIKISLDFVETVYELAFGDNAIDGNFTESEVIEKLKEMSDALAVLEN